jgi:hypothetical protein
MKRDEIILPSSPNINQGQEATMSIISQTNSKFSSTITFPQILNTAPVISRVGGEDVFAELSFRRLGDGQIELVCTRVEYSAQTGRYLRDELGREVVEEEDAENAAVDLQYAAKEALGDDYYSMPADPCGFGEAVDLELVSIYSVAAE